MGPIERLDMARRLPTVVDRPMSESSSSRVALALAGVVAAYLATTLIVPIEMTYPILDEPIFASSAFRFAETGEVLISNLSAPNAVFDTIWGGVFVRLLGESLGVLRLSTLVLVAISAPFMFALCRDLGAPSLAALLGTAAYLFAPLGFALSYTFLTDAHAMALVVIAASLFTKALKRPDRAILLTTTFSVVSALAILSRPQTLILVPAAAYVWIRSAGTTGRKIQGLLALSFAPVVTIVGHSIWTAATGEPLLREVSRASALNREMSDVLGLGAQTLVMTPIYVGLFVLPVVALFVPRWSDFRAWLETRAGFIFSATVLAIWVVTTLRGWGPFYFQTWITHSGIGAVDRSFLGSRPLLIPMWMWAVVGLLLVAAFIAFGSAVSVGARDRNPSPQRTFVLFLLGGSVVGVFVSSLGLQDWVLDRYWLAVLPFVIALGLGRSRIAPSRVALAGAGVVLVGLFSLIGTVDSYVLYEEGSSYAEELVSEGVEPNSFDGGASWAASQFGLSEGDVSSLVDGNGPWWNRFFGSPSEPDLALALEPLEKTKVDERRKYRSFLHVAETYLFVLERGDRDSFYSDWRNH